MITQTFADIVTPELSEGAFIHDVFPGFKEDYLVLHCLLRKHFPEAIKADKSGGYAISVFEVGTNVGNGVNVIASALPYAYIYSLDLDFKTMKRNSKQYPVGSSGEDRVGSEAKFSYKQLRGDSMSFEYEKYPCDAAFIDGEHDYKHPHHETRQVLKWKPKLVIYHDSDIPEVMAGIVEGMGKTRSYDLYRVTDTRIAYLLKKQPQQ